MGNFVELNRKDGSRILIAADKILSIADDEGSAVVRFDNGSFQVLKQSYDEIIKMFYNDGDIDEL